MAVESVPPDPDSFRFLCGLPLYEAYRYRSSPPLAIAEDAADDVTVSGRVVVRTGDSLRKRSESTSRKLFYI